MTPLGELAVAALAGDALEVRSRVQDLPRLYARWTDVPAPTSSDMRVRSLAAALVELFAERNGDSPPKWSATIGAVAEPIHLLRSTRQMTRLRALCEESSPPSLKSRGFFAPANYLLSA